MPHVHAQVTLPYDSALPEDVAVNNWSFDLASLGDTNYDQVRDFLNAFYDGISVYISRAINPDAASVKIYARDDAEPRVPRYESLLTIDDDQAAGGLPEEVAVCFSFRGVLASGAPAARRRGRVYLGPLNNLVLDADSGTNRSRVAIAFATDVFEAYEAAWGALTTAGNVHEVWSSANDEGYTVVQAWMDNAFDTQRRRGAAPTSRTVADAPF